MALSTSLRNAARNLINTFGNSASLYTYSSATKSSNEEGDVTVSSWGTPATILVVDGDNAKEILTQAEQGMESLGNDEKIIRDDVTIAVNDRIIADSINYRVTELKPVRTQSTVIIQIVVMTRVEDTSNW